MRFRELIFSYFLLRRYSIARIGGLIWCPGQLFHLKRSSQNFFYFFLDPQKEKTTGAFGSSHRWGTHHCLYRPDTFYVDIADWVELPITENSNEQTTKETLK